MRQVLVRSAVILLSALCGSAPIAAQDTLSAPANSFAQITALTGEWQVREEPALRIVFEPTAGGSVIVERWMVGARMHAMTAYHRDGERMLATHYCPQGNQPRLAAAPAGNGEIRFSFVDVADLDPGESYQHDLAFRPQADGSVVRAETYRGPDGALEESTFLLVPAAG